jgi:hypothetical protein
MEREEVARTDEKRNMHTEFWWGNQTGIITWEA